MLIEPLLWLQSIPLGHYLTLYQNQKQFIEDSIFLTVPKASIMAGEALLQAARAGNWEHIFTCKHDAEKPGAGQGYTITLKAHPLPPASLHFLNTLWPLQAPPIRDPLFKYVNLFSYKPTQPPLWSCDCQMSSGIESVLRRGSCCFSCSPFII